MSHPAAPSATGATGGGSGPSTSGAPATATTTTTTTTTTAEVLTLRLVPRRQRNKKAVRWTEDVVDNEFAGKKSSKSELCGE